MKNFLATITRIFFAISLITYVGLSLCGEFFPAWQWGGTDVWLLAVIAFGIIGVRFGRNKNDNHDLHPRITPYVMGGMAAMVALIYFFAASISLFAWIGIAAYALGALLAILLIAFEDT